jgi:phage terminase large subunit
MGSGWTPKDIKEIASRMVRWTEDAEGPVRFARDVLGVEPVPNQKAMLRAVASFVPGGGKFGVTVRSGQGCGKSTGAAMVMSWFLVCHRNCLIQATAPKEKQLHSILWGEMDKLIRSSKFLSSVLEWQATRIGVRGEANQWQAIARTARNIESLQGEHRKDMLLVADECSGIEDAKLEALIGGLTEPHNLALLISNPTVPHGLFFDSHNKNAHLWTPLHFNGRESPLVNRAHIARMESQYGAGSPIIQVRVDGNFPTQSETSLISLSWLLDAKERPTFDVEDAPIEMGVDVARYGADMTAVCIRQGNNILFLERWHGMNITESCGKIVSIARDFPDLQTIKLDESGIGAGLLDIMHENQSSGTLKDVDIIGVNAGEASNNTELWPLLRDEFWCVLASRLQDGLIAFGPDCDPDMIDLFVSQCMAVDYSFTVHGQRKIETKEQIRKKTGFSPDLADAVLFAFHEGSVGVMGWI